MAENTPKYKKTEKVLNNCGTDCYKNAPKARELSDASMSVRKKQEQPKKTELQGEKIAFKVIFKTGKACNVVSESSEKIAKYISENIEKIQKVIKK